MKKAVFIDPTFYNTFYSTKVNLVQPLNVFCRNSLLVPKALNTSILVHNGKSFLKVRVSANIIGHKLGDFSFSRQSYFFKKGKKVKSKK